VLLSNSSTCSLFFPESSAVAKPSVVKASAATPPSKIGLATSNALILELLSLGLSLGLYVDDGEFLKGED
jgi:hypothetical protein